MPSSPVSRKSRKINYSELSDDDDEDNEDDDGPIKPKKKRRRVIAWDDADDEDFEMGSDKEVASEHGTASEEEDDDITPDKNESKQELAELVDNSVVDDASDDEDVIDIAVKAKPQQVTRKQTRATSNLSNVLGSRSAANKSTFLTPQKKFNKENEERYQWLINLKDADGHEESDPEYDPRTLYIPQSAWLKFTAFEKQYWTIKSTMWDTVVFFKKGKFFELYERDADIAHSKFDLKLAGTGRANMRLAGVPEMSFDYWAKRFISAGYKVAKVDQKESLLAKEIRQKNGTASKEAKESKVIQRELEYILTCGTLIDENLLNDEMSKYCLAIKELVDYENNTKLFGVCFVDVSTGNFQILEFSDDFAVSYTHLTLPTN